MHEDHDRFHENRKYHVEWVSGCVCVCKPIFTEIAVYNGHTEVQDQLKIWGLYIDFKVMLIRVLQ